MMQQITGPEIAILVMYLASATILCAIGIKILKRSKQPGLENVLYLGAYIFCIGILQAIIAMGFLPWEMKLFTINLRAFIGPATFYVILLFIIMFVKETFYKLKKGPYNFAVAFCSIIFGAILTLEILNESGILTMQETFMVVFIKGLLNDLLANPLVFGWQVLVALSTLMRLKDRDVPRYVMNRYLIYAIGCFLYIGSGIINSTGIYMHIILNPGIMVYFQVFAESMIVMFSIISYFTWIKPKPKTMKSIPVGDELREIKEG
ncbi:hypothetical protein GF325_15785 [Candidatus Bathyarchaeota archaeon]|nr:hypothetical protein [Candidatus Bathyarchaeota archaeon]